VCKENCDIIVDLLHRFIFKFYLFANSIHFRIIFVISEGKLFRVVS
jgi:hypothetical protein